MINITLTPEEATLLKQLLGLDLESIGFKYDEVEILYNIFKKI